jgi:hypothetical protein
VVPAVVVVALVVAVAVAVAVVVLLEGPGTPPPRPWKGARTPQILFVTAMKSDKSEQMVSASNRHKHTLTRFVLSTNSSSVPIDVARKRRPDRERRSSPECKHNKISRMFLGVSLCPFNVAT